MPDEKTIWAFREHLIERNMLQKLFERFDRHLNTEGYSAQKGTIIDASLMPARIQRNTDDEKELLKSGAIPVEWAKNPNQLRQKDKRSVYGYKNHITVDVKHKLIRCHAVTDAAVADVGLFNTLLKKIDNTNPNVYADKGYIQGNNEEKLQKRGYIVNIPHKMMCQPFSV